MSENITILEGGKSESFGQIAKLKTSNGDGHDLWVPKEYVETKHLSVKKNGLHYTNQYTPTASEKKSGKFHDVYGWDTITVSVKQKTKGKKKKKSSKTGLDYDASLMVDVDDDGNLIETELPVYIEIEQPPDKLEYRDGESISKKGMVVKAYYGDDREWGVVPNDETTLDPSTAQGDSEQKEYDKDGVHAIGFLCNVYNDSKYANGYHSNIPYSIEQQYVYNFFVRATVGYAYFTRYNGNVYYASFDATAVNRTYGTYNSDGSGSMGTNYLGGYSSTNGQFGTARTSIAWNPFFLALIPESEVDPTLTPAEGGGADYGEATSDLETNWEQPIRFYDYAECITTYSGPRKLTATTLNGSVLLIARNDNNGYAYYWVSQNSGLLGRLDGLLPFWEGDGDIYDSKSVTINGKTAYYGYHIQGLRDGYYGSSPYVEGVDNPDENTIWTAVYGDITSGGTSDQTITVGWIPSEDEDGEELTDTFDITVIPSN